MLSKNSDDFSVKVKSFHRLIEQMLEKMVKNQKEVDKVKKEAIGTRMLEICKCQMCYLFSVVETNKREKEKKKLNKLILQKESEIKKIERECERLDELSREMLTGLSTLVQ